MSYGHNRTMGSEDGGAAASDGADADDVEVGAAILRPYRRLRFIVIVTAA